MHCGLITNLQEALQCVGLPWVKPMAISPAGNAASGPGENHGLLSEEGGGPRRGAQACCCHWATELQEPGGLCAGNCAYYMLITAHLPPMSNSWLHVPRQVGKTRHPRTRLWTMRLSSAPLGVKLSGSRCPAVCPVSLLSAVFIDSAP